MLLEDTKEQNDTIFAVCQVEKPISPGELVEKTSLISRKVGSPKYSIKIRNDNVLLEVTIERVKKWDKVSEDNLGLMLGSLAGGSVAIDGPIKADDTAKIHILSEMDNPFAMSMAKQAFIIERVGILNIPNSNDCIFIVLKKDLDKAKDALKTRRIDFEVIDEEM